MDLKGRRTWLIFIMTVVS